jgi:hypothetical protein
VDGDNQKETRSSDTLFGGCLTVHNYSKFSQLRFDVRINSFKENPVRGITDSRDCRELEIPR